MRSHVFSMAWTTGWKAGESGQAHARRGGRLRRLGEILERCGHAGLADGNPGELQAHFHAAQRAGEREVVEVAEMADAKDLALHLAQPGAERHVEALEDDLAHLVGILA